jgi:hypothetical protein
LDRQKKQEKRNAREFKKYALKPLDNIIKEIKTHKVLLEKTQFQCMIATDNKQEWDQGQEQI